MAKPLRQIVEKWNTDYETPESEKGKYKGWTLEQLRAARHKPGTDKKELNFAIRAKTGWGKVSEEAKDRPFTKFAAGAIYGKQGSKALHQGRCPVCKGEAKKFKDELSRREHKISGMCQKCQDKTFREETELNEVDVVTLSVPLFIRMLEYAKEDAKTDMDLHKATENILNLSNGKALDMDSYEDIVEDVEQLDEAKWKKKKGPSQKVDIKTGAQLKKEKAERMRGLKRAGKEAKESGEKIKFRPFGRWKYKGEKSGAVEKEIVKKYFGDKK